LNERSEFVFRKVTIRDLTEQNACGRVSFEKALRFISQSACKGHEMIEVKLQNVSDGGEHFLRGHSAIVFDIA